MSINGVSRRDFERLLVKGVDLTDMPVECSGEYLSLWMKRINHRIDSVDTPSISHQGRRLNNFCLGSDPEFVFTDGSHKINAAHIGLKPGLAAGCDQNQRLAELRCWPTSSVLEHTAGVLASLRWMYRLYPDTRKLKWRAGGWFDNDGIGGHVHFGRKRPNRENEVKGLDGLATALQQTAFFSNNDWQRRQGGDAHRQRYGDFGDTRPQIHGYEYRTLPSWLESPARAFMVLTLSKLVVLDPELTSAWLLKKDSWTGVNYFAAMRYLADYYSGRDDDALILKFLLAESNRESLNHPWLMTNDFRASWGFQESAAVSKLPTRILASCVKPCDSEVEEILHCLVDKKPLGYVENAPTFKNEIPSGGYFWFYDRIISNVARSGVGDIVHNLVGNKSDNQSFVFGTDSFIIHPLTVKRWTSKEFTEVKELFPDLRVARIGEGEVTSFSREMTMVPLIQKTRHFLLKMGLFPLWTVDTVTPNSYAEYVEKRKALVGKIKSPHKEERTL